jgi:hypothetical protein
MWPWRSRLWASAAAASGKTPAMGTSRWLCVIARSSRANHRGLASTAWRFRFDAVGKCHRRIGTQQVEAALERFAAGKRQRGIDAVRRELPEPFDRIVAPRIDDGGSAEAPHQRCRLPPGGRRQNVRSSLPRELHRERAHRTRRAEDQDGLPSAHTQPGIDALQRSQPGGNGGARLQRVETRRNAADVFGPGDHVLGVEAALRIAELVGIDAIADAKAPDARPFRDDEARAVRARHERECRGAGTAPGAIADGSVPRSHAGGLQPDQHLVRARRRHRALTQPQRRWRAEAVDRRGLHRVGTGQCIAASHAFRRPSRGAP